MSYNFNVNIYECMHGIMYGILGENEDRGIVADFNSADSVFSVQTDISFLNMQRFSISMWIIGTGGVISTNFIIGTGFMKCMPITISGRDVSAAI